MHDYVEAVIEMPTGVQYKYEHEQGTGTLVLDRVLNQPVPFNYGYIPDTMSEDGDPSDIFVISSLAVYPLAKVAAHLVGKFKCTDQGVPDDKYVSVLVGDTWVNDDLGLIRDYLESYKVGFEVLGFEFYPDERQ